MRIRQEVPVSWPQPVLELSCPAKGTQSFAPSVSPRWLGLRTAAIGPKTSGVFTSFSSSAPSLTAQHSMWKSLKALCCVQSFHLLSYRYWEWGIRFLFRWKEARHWAQASFLPSLFFIGSNITMYRTSCGRCVHRLRLHTSSVLCSHPEQRLLLESRG